MIRLRRASVIATLSLLACTATASAECAWVLWQHQGVSPVGQPPERWGWHPAAAASNGQECQKVLAQNDALLGPKDVDGYHT